MSRELRTVVIVDYQNVHLTGHGVFAQGSVLPRHQTLIDPLLFAQQLLRERNARQAEGRAHAVLHSVLAFRGQPSPEHDPKGYARSQAQKAPREHKGRNLLLVECADEDRLPASPARSHPAVLEHLLARSGVQPVP